MGLMEILQQYAGRPTDTETDFDEVAPQVPADVMGDGLAHAFKADKTPPFGDMVGQLFGNSNSQQRAGVLDLLFRTVGPAVLANIAGGAFAKLAGRGSGDVNTAPTVAPADTAQVTPEQVRDIAAQAEKMDPNILDRIGGFYGQHPQAVKVLGGAALAIALGQIANRMKM